MRSETTHCRNWEFVAPGSLMRKAPVFTARSCSRSMASLSVEAISTDDVTEAAWAFCAVPRATARDPTMETPTPTTTTRTATTIQPRLRSLPGGGELGTYGDAVVLPMVMAIPPVATPKTAD